MSLELHSAKPEDQKIIKDIEAAILSKVGGRKGLEKKFPNFIPPRLGRGDRYAEDRPLDLGGYRAK